jgi:hypothetical protein
MRRRRRRIFQRWRVVHRRIGGWRGCGAPLPLHGDDQGGDRRPGFVDVLPFVPPFRIKVARQRSLLQRGELQLSEIVRGMLIIVLGRLHLRGVNKV